MSAGAIRLGVVAGLLCGAGAAFGQVAFEAPVSEQTLTAPGPGNDPGRALTIHCATYARFMVRDVHEGQDIGTAAMGVAAPNGAGCGAEKPASVRDLPEFGGMDVAGVLGRFLVLMWPDGANGGTTFGVFDGVAGRKLYTDFVKHDGFKRLAVAAGGDALELRFVRTLSLPCSVVAGGAGCWTKATKELKLPAEIARRPAPVALCAAADAASGGKVAPPTGNPHVIAYEVEMVIAASGAVRVLSRGALSCASAE